MKYISKLFFCNLLYFSLVLSQNIIEKNEEQNNTNSVNNNDTILPTTTTTTTTTIATTTIQENSETTTKLQSDSSSTTSKFETTTIPNNLIHDGYVTEKQEVGTAKIYKINRQPKYKEKNNISNCPRPAIVYLKNNCTCPTPEPCPEVDHLVCEPCPICEEKTIIKTIHYQKVDENHLSHRNSDFIIETSDNYSHNRLSQNMETPIIDNKDDNKDNNHNNDIYLSLSNLYKIYPKLTNYINNNNNDQKTNIINESISLKSGISSILTVYCIDIFNKLEKKTIVESIYTLGKIDRENNKYSCEYKYKIYILNDNIDEVITVNRMKTEVELKNIEKNLICNDGIFRHQC